MLEPGIDAVVGPLCCVATTCAFTASSPCVQSMKRRLRASAFDFQQLQRRQRSTIPADSATTRRRVAAPSIELDCRLRWRRAPSRCSCELRSSGLEQERLEVRWNWMGGAAESSAGAATALEMRFALKQKRKERVIRNFLGGTLPAASAPGTRITVAQLEERAAGGGR
jgi:hypothetical protein